MKSSIAEIINTPKLLISKLLWSELILQLRNRGENRRESGAFLLASPDSQEIRDFICYDDLDPSCYDTGIIVLQSAGYRPLWEYCTSHALTAIADVHTHPIRWTGQSAADKAHPMIVQQGHISLIVPRYAQGNIRSLKGVGFHEYLGDLRWKTHSITSSQFQLS
jgi:hypothetical protein